MHTCTPLLELERAPEADSSHVEEAIRSLLSILNGPERSGVKNFTTSCGTEQVLVDAVVDDMRYLVIRMPRPYSRIQLRPREQEIVRMVAQGHPNKVIADVPRISAWTVCTHLRRIFAKLGVGSRAAMVAKLPERGVILTDYQPYQPLANPR
jgi:DNA-binding CsgD family transcriptional regulator